MRDTVSYPSDIRNTLGDVEETLRGLGLKIRFDGDKVLLLHLHPEWCVTVLWRTFTGPQVVTWPTPEGEFSLIGHIVTA